MAGIKPEKTPSAEELYAKATSEGIPFFQWHEWLKNILR
jgi:hypothetical protein